MDENRLPSSPPTCRRAPADSRSNLAGFHPATANFLPLRPASPPLSTGRNGDSVVLCFADSGRPNSIYVSSGPSGPIFIFLIQFEFYPTKRSRFEIFSPPMPLESDIVFYIIFPDFFFKIFEFEFQKSVIFKFGPGRSRRILAIFGKIGRIFKPWFYHLYEMEERFSSFLRVLG
jgi:hypothetical protein